MFRFAADRETNGLNFRKVFMQQMLTETEKLEIIEHEWAKARAKDPEVIMRVHVQDETDEGGKPRVNVVIAFSGAWAAIKKCPRKNSSNSKALRSRSFRRLAIAFSSLPATSSWPPRSASCDRS